MGPLKLVNKVVGHEMDRHLGCINGILQILKSIPEIETMFQARSYKLGCEDDMPICDEISRLFRTEKKQETSAADLRMLIRIFAGEIVNFFGVEQDIEICFRVLHTVIENEMNASNEQSKEIWKKFNTKGKSNLSFSNCKAGKTEFFNLPVPFLEVSNMTVSRLIKKIDEHQYKECRFCGVQTKALNLKSLDPLPDYLLVKLSRTEAAKNLIVFPENRMQLLNGDTYKLRCIVDHDPPTERYVTSVIDDNTWVHCDGTEHTLASKEDVKTHNNHLYLYVKDKTFVGALPFDKYKCIVDGCPLDERLESREELRRHTEREHPECVHCKKTFLLNCLFKEHMQENQECKLGRRSDSKKVNFLKPENDSEMYTDSGLDSMSDSTAEEAIKVAVKRNNL